MAIDVVTSVILIIVACMIYSIAKKKRTNYRPPPGPRPYPIIGNLLELSGSDGYIAMANIAKQYGDIYSLTFPGGQEAVVISTADLVREAFLTKKDDFSGRPYSYIGDALTRGSKDIICADFTPTMLNLRKVAHSALKMYGQGMQRLEDQICSEADDLAKRFHEHKGEPVAPKADICVTVLNVICALVYGQRYSRHEPEFEKIVEYNDQIMEIFGSFNILDLLPWLRYFPIRSTKLLESAKNTRDEILNKKYYEHKEKFMIENANNNFQIQDLTDALLKAFDESQTGNEKDLVLTEDSLMMTMNDIFNAGFETTSSTLQWILIYMVHHPHVQAKVQTEMEAAVGHGRLPRLKDREKLPYTRAVIAEVMRITTPAPLGLIHKSTKNTSLAGYDIPKGQLLIANLWAVHHNPKDWPNPHQFMPERFLDDEGNLDLVNQKAYLPFSAGRRHCLGESLAKSEIFLLTARLLHQFTFKNSPDSPLPSLKGRQGVVLQPEPFKLVAEERL